MFDMSWGEVMVIGGVALIVIGPKDLPKALRTVGQMTTKVRRLAAEFQSQFNEAMREAELEDVKKEMEGLNREVSNATSTAFNPIQTIRDELKGAIDAKPAEQAPIPVDTPVPLPAEAPVVEEVGAVPQITPAAPAASGPGSPEPLPPDLPTGPGLEGSAEPLTLPPRGHAA